MLSRKNLWRVLGGAVLLLSGGLLTPGSAHALTYVSLLEDPPAAEVQQALNRGVDIDVYWSVYSETYHRTEWRLQHLANQHSLTNARNLIYTLLEENRRLPQNKQHQITIGWTHH